MIDKQVHVLEKLAQDDDEVGHPSDDTLLNLKVVYFKDGRRILVKPAGMVDVAIHEFDAKVVEVIVENTDEAIPSFERN